MKKRVFLSAGCDCKQPDLSETAGRAIDVVARKAVERDMKLVFNCFDRGDNLVAERISSATQGHHDHVCMFSRTTLTVPHHWNFDRRYSDEKEAYRWNGSSGQFVLAFFIGDSWGYPLYGVREDFNFFTHPQRRRMHARTRCYALGWTGRAAEWIARQKLKHQQDYWFEEPRDLDAFIEELFKC